MELSKGFSNLSKNISKHYSSPYSLIPVKAVLEKLIINNPLSIIPLNTEEIKQKNKFEASIALEDSAEKLQRLFTQCCLGGDSNKNKMPLSKFINFLKECGIISKKFTVTEAQLIFTKAIRQEEEKNVPEFTQKNEISTKIAKRQDVRLDKLDLKAFISAMGLIAGKFYSDLNPQQALRELTTNVK